MSSLDYGRTAAFYGFMEFIYFGNVIRRSRNRLLADIPFQPRSALIAGCGSGDFLPDFLRKCSPKLLTLNDLSQKMLDHSLKRVRNAGYSGTLQLENRDVMELHPEARFDFISLNYVLDIYPPVRQIELLRHLHSLLEDGGILQIADFTFPRNPLMIPLFWINWLANIVGFWIMAGNPSNRLGDPERHFGVAGWHILRHEHFVGGLFGSFLLHKHGQKILEREITALEGTDAPAPPSNTKTA